MKVNIIKICCRIKIIFAILLILPAAASAAEWETGIAGAWSVASRQLPASNVYSAANAETRFMDFGGRLAHRVGQGYLGLSLHLYTSFGLREQLVGNNIQVQNFLAEQSAATGLPVSFNTGTYRLALAWNALQLRYRHYLWDFFFTEVGAGVAYGFGAIEAVLRGNTSSGEVISTYYHRYAEWGFISSVSAGISLPLGDAIRFEAACEFAWLWARIREPNIFAQGEFTLSQTFFRQMVGVTLKF